MINVKGRGGWSLFLQVAVAMERLRNVWSWVRGDVTDGDDTILFRGLHSSVALVLWCVCIVG